MCAGNDYSELSEGSAGKSVNSRATPANLLSYIKDESSLFAPKSQLERRLEGLKSARVALIDRSIEHQSTVIESLQGQKKQVKNQIYGQLRLMLELEIEPKDKIFNKLTENLNTETRQKIRARNSDPKFTEAGYKFEAGNLKSEIRKSIKDNYKKINRLDGIINDPDKIKLLEENRHKVILSEIRHLEVLNREIDSLVKQIDDFDVSPDSLVKSLFLKLKVSQETNNPKM